MSNVVTHTRFGSASALRDRGIDAAVADAYDDVVLNEPAYGERIIGTLDADECALFADLYRTSIEVERLTREYAAAAITRVGEAIRKADLHKPLHEALKGEESQLYFGSDDNRQEFYRLQQRAQALHATLHWSMGERLSAHDKRLGVRSKFRVVVVSVR